MCLFDKEYEIQIEIENQCYLDCLHCSSLLMRNSPANLITNNELLEVLKLFNSSVHVYFSGGEPLANANIEGLIRTAKNASLNSKVGIFTCGILKGNTPIDKNYAERLKSIGLDDCYISLYHFDYEKHDYITNKKGSFHVTMKSLQALINAQIDVKVHLVITKYNYKQLDEVIDSIISLGVSQVRLLRLVKIGSADSNWENIGVSYEKQNKAVMKIISIIQKYCGKVTISGFPKYISCRPAPNAIKCQAGTNLLYVTSSKQVFPCACTKGSSFFQIGNMCELDKLKEYLDRQRNIICNEDCLNPIGMNVLTSNKVLS